VDVAEPRAPVSRRRRRWESITAALVAALPLLTIFFWLCLIYGWQAWGNPAPWLNSDEFERAQLARAIAATGHEAQRTVPHAFDSLYTYLIAPAWRIGDMSRAYGVAKGIGVVTMTAIVFPAYLLARLFVAQRWALFACVAAAANQRMRRVISVFAMSQKQSAAVGYASGSWSSISEYASAGIAAAATQANSAQRCETNSRASRYAGKTTAVIVTTPIPFATPYARDVSPIRHAGAIK
jgi:hypothetical protein